MAKLTTHSIGGEVLACACALFGAVSQAQTLNLPATLSSGAYAASSTVTNCTGTVSQANCTSVTLANNATVTLAAATQIVLGPGFTAVAGNASTSLVAAIVPAPTVSAVTVSPASVTSGGSATVTVTLSSNALYAVAVALTSSNTAAFNPPASITVAAGQITGSATVTAGTVSASTPVTVTGSYNSSSRQGSVTVLPPQIVLTSVSVSPSSVISTNSATVTVTLSGAAPSGGAVVTLGSSNATAFNPPASITVPAGQMTATSALIAAGTVSSSTNVTITGNYGGPQTGLITVLPLPALSLISVAPNSGSIGSQIFTVTAGDSIGVGDLTSVFLLASTSPAVTAGACYVRYDLATNSVFLADNSGNWQPGIAVGLSAFLENSQCLLRADLSTAAPSGNNNLAVAFDLSFKPSFNGAKSLYAAAADAFSNTGLTAEGSWTVSQPLSVTSPAISGSGPGETFTTVFTDANGAANLSSLWLWLGKANSPTTTTVPNSCLINYTLATNMIGLYADNAATLSTITPGPGALSNSQCSVTGAGASVTLSGNTATLTLPLSFSAAYSGALNILAFAADASQNTGWYKLGTWTATAPAWPALSVSSTHSGSFTLGQNSGATYTLTVTNGVFATATDGSQVTVTEVVPSGMTLVSMSGAGWTCTNNTCTVGGVLAPGASYPPITVTVNVSANAVGPLVNSVSVSGGASAAAGATDNTALADFAIGLNATSVTTIMVGGSATYSVTVTAAPGFSGTVTLAAIGLPAGAPLPNFSPPTVSFSNAFGTQPVTATSVLTVTTPASGADTPNIAVGGAAWGTLTHISLGIPLTVQDFTIAASPSSSSSVPLGVIGGQTVNFAVSATGLNGFSGPITVSLGLPNCGNCLSGGNTSTVLYPYPGNSGNVYFNIASGAQTASYNYSVNGAAQGVTHVTPGLLNIAAQDISVSLAQNPLNTASAPGSANFTLTVASINNFAGNVAFSAYLPTGWPSVFIPQLTVPAGGSAQAQFTVTVPSGASPNTYQITVAVSGAPNLRTGYATLAVGSSTGPALSISSALATAFYQGQSGAAYALTISNQSGAAPTSGAVSVAETLPTGLTLASMSGTGSTCQRSDSLAAGSSYPQITVTVNVALNAPSTVYNQVSVSGGGSVAASAAESTAIQGPSAGPGFTITASPASQTVIPGAAAVYTLSVAAQGSFTGAVSLSMGAIAGASAYLSSSTVQPGAPVTLTVNTFSTTVLGPASIPVTAIAGSITQTATLTLSVQALTVNPGNPTTATVPPILANSTPVPATYNFNAGSGTWITASSCSTNDPNVTVGVSNQTSSQATITYSANALTSSRIVAASCTYTCPGGTGPITFPPVTVSPAPVIFPNGVTDLEGNPNPTVYAGVPTTLLIQGEYFGTTPGSIGVCPAGSSNPCVVPQNICNPGCGAYNFVQWNDGLIEVVLTLPSDATGAWDLFVTSIAWISGYSAAHPSLGGFNSGQAPPTVTVTPMDISGNPGDVFIFTATGVSPTGASGAMQFQWSITEDGTYPGTFNFVSSTCTSGSSCATVSPPACTGSLTCTAYVQGTSPGFANLGVVFQVNSVNSQPQNPRMRQMTVTITKIWSNQFPNGPIANYLPGDGTPTNPNGSGSGAGLIGNARQLLIVGAGQSPPSSFFSKSFGYIKANVVTVPASQEALNHTLVRLQPDDPLPPGTPNPQSTEGSGSVTGSVFSVSTLQLLGDQDYSVVAGPDRSGNGQAGGYLSPTDVQYTFYLPCPVPPATGAQGLGPCLNGAVRIPSWAESQSTEALGTLAGSAFAGFALPTAQPFLSAFLSSSAPAGSYVGTPTVNNSSIMTTGLLYYNTGLVFSGTMFGPSPLWNFAPFSPVGNTIMANPDFQQLLQDTLIAHKPDVIQYFSNPTNSGATTYTFPGWIVHGTCQANPGQCSSGSFGSQGSTVPLQFIDYPPIFPCADTPTVQCQLTFSSANSLDLANAFGRVGFSLLLTATISPVSGNPSQFNATSVAVSGFVYDYYQWNPNQGFANYLLANVQAGYNSLGSGGQVYKTIVDLYTTSIGGFTYVF